MYYALAFLVGVITGGVGACVFLIDRHARMAKEVQNAASKVKSANTAIERARVRESELDAREATEREQIIELERRAKLEIGVLESEGRNRIAQLEQRLKAEFALREAEVNKRRDELERRIINYREFQNENAILKRDLQNIDVNLNKLQMDGELREQAQRTLDERATQLAKRYLGETVKSVVSAIGPSNYSACKQRLIDVIVRCREIGFEVPTEEETKLTADLKKEFERAVRLAFEREEQARIKAQIREEERLKREIDRELKQLERERIAIQAALDQALAEARGQHSAEVDRLQARLAEAEEKSKRTMSMAEQTKAGHVYVISNIGTFGLGIFKIGMTRRLEPKDRIAELGSASVPFPFDVHMMISCPNAPALENALHRALHKRRINKANPRKEFFKVELDEIIRIVKEHHGEVQYVVDPEALEYRQTLTMSDDDSLFIESVYEAVEDETTNTGDED
jgi:hypothetical protein